MPPFSLFQRAREALEAVFSRKHVGPELGYGGTRISGGIVLDEHVQELKGRAAIQTATKMRRSDGTVRAAEKILSLPIRSTVWYVEAPKDATPAEDEAKELLRANLFGGMVGSFDDLLREACLGIYYGFRVPEIVWEERAGQIAIRKVASRNPELIEAWLHDQAGELVGYLYSGDRPVGNGLTTYAAGVTKYEQVPIPLTKTLHFVYDQENENPAGFGLWRSMYGHWYIKQILYKVLAVGIERNLLDVPVGKMKGGKDTDRTAFLRLLKRWRAAEDAALVLPEGYEVEWQGSSRSLMDAMPYLQHHDTKILQAALASFMNLGQGTTGTQALGEVLGRMFEMAEEANAKWIEATLNQQLVKRWGLLNYGEDFRLPVIKHKPIKSNDLQVWSAALNAFMSAGALHPTVDDETHIRDRMELPAIPKEQLETMAQEREAKELEEQKAERERLTLGQNQPPKQKGPVEATDCEHGRTFADEDAAARRQERADQEQDFAERAGALLQGIQERYLAALRPLVEESQAGGKLSGGKPLADLVSVPVPGVRRYEEFVRGYLRDVLDAGRQAFADETGSDLSGTPIPNRLRSWINARAKVIATDHASQLQTAVLMRVLTGIRAEMDASLIFSDAGAIAIEELSRNTQRDWAAAAAEVVALIGEAD